MFSDGALAVGTGENTYKLESYSVPDASVTAQGLGGSNASMGFSLDDEGGVLYVGSFGNVCTLARYATGMSNTPTTVYPVGANNSCSALLAAGNTAGEGTLGAEAAIYDVAGALSIMVFDATYFATKGSGTIAAVDANAFVVMNDGTTNFRVVHSTNGAAYHVFNGQAAEVNASSLVTLDPNAGVRLWDAVSDGPTATSYGFVYWSGGPPAGLWFQHYCN